MTARQASYCIRSALKSENFIANSLETESLEERILYSASPIAELVIEANADQSTQQGESESQQSPQQVVVIDRSIDDYGSLVQDLDSSGQFSIELLDLERDGVQQISELLDKYGQVDALHIVSNSSAGQVALGNTILDSQTLDVYADQVTAWSASLGVDAGIIFHGSDVAGSEEGRELVNRLSALTSTEVASSFEITCHPSLGGEEDVENAPRLVGTEIFASTNHPSQSIAETGEILVNQNSPTAIGNEEATRVGNDGAGSAVGIADDGSYVVVWTGRSNNTANDVYFQRFDRFGDTLGSAVLVNQTTQSNQDEASVAVNRDGSFIVVWENSSGQNIFMRQFDAQGNPLGNSINPNGDEYIVHSAFTAGRQANQSIAINDAGQFVVSWQGSGPGGANGIFARTFNADGTPNTDIFHVSVDQTIGVQASVSVGIDGAGNSRFVWEDERFNRIASTMFDFDGAKTSGTFVAPIFQGTRTFDAAIDTREDGYSVVVFTIDTVADDGTSIGVIVLNPELQTPFQVVGFPIANQTTVGDQVSPSVTFNDDDTIIVAWEGPNGTTGDLDVFYREFVATEVDPALDLLEATPISDEQQLNITSAGVQQNVSIASLDAGNWVAVWSGNGPGDANGVFARQFGSAVDFDLDADDSSSLTGGDYQTDVVAGASSSFQAIADTDVVIAPSNLTFESVQIELIGFVDGSNEEVSVAGQVFSAGVSGLESTVVGGTSIDINFDGHSILISESNGEVIDTDDIKALIATLGYRNTGDMPARMEPEN